MFRTYFNGHGFLIKDYIKDCTKLQEGPYLPKPQLSSPMGFPKIGPLTTPVVDGVYKRIAGSLLRIRKHLSTYFHIIIRAPVKY